MRPKVHVFQHVSFEGPDAIGDLCKQKKLPVKFTQFFADSWQLPRLDDFDLLVVMGGPMGVYDCHQYPWLEDEKQLIAKAIEAGKKVFGVCLGAQLIAAAMGAKVYPAKNKEIGWFAVEKTEQAKELPLVKALPGCFDVFQWHGDTYDLPQGCTQLFRSDACEQQGFSLNSQVVALQFHIEVTPAGILGFLAHNGQELDTPAAFVQSAQVITGNLAITEKVRPLLTALLDAFLVDSLVGSY